ncbi:MAG: hypothetical protein M0R66_07220 [Candidatus Omnitrophica bacterium]|jgi:hypothetical protein|nr:hypothetical protein [Candidatus Omnitrophota bacterium]
MVCFGNRFASRDGDTRGIAIFEHHFRRFMLTPAWDAMENYFIQFLGSAHLVTHFYFPRTHTAGNKRAFKKKFFGKRLDFNIAVAHFYAAADAYGITPIEDRRWLSSAEDMIPRIIKSANALHGGESIGAVIVSAAEKQIFVLKLVPITINELRNANDIRYRVWREHFIQQTCTQIQHSGVAMHQLTIYRDWSMIFDIDGAMFANPFMIAKLRRSDIVREINRSMIAIEATTPRENAANSGVTGVAHDVYRDDFDAIIAHSSDNLIMSGVAIVFISSYRSVKFAPEVCDRDAMMDIVFGWLYALAVLHSHVGAIHADAHIGNLRMMRLRYAFGVVIGDVQRAMRSRHTGHIIDFSRSIINPFFPPVARYTSSHPEVIAREQERSLINFFASMYPAHDSERAVRDLVRDDYERAFNILSLLDPIRAMRAVIDAVRAESRDDVSAIISACEAKLFAGIADPSSINMSAYPLVDILRAFPGVEPYRAGADTDEWSHFARPFEYPDMAISSLTADEIARAMDAIDEASKK